MSQILKRLASVGPLQGLSVLKPMREKRTAMLGQRLWPTRKAEDWKYTNLNAIESGEYFFSDPKNSIPVDLGVLKSQIEIQNLDTYKLVFVNGVQNVELSSAAELPAGLDLVCFANATEDQSQVIQAYLDTLIDHKKHLFVEINTHLFNNGVLLRVKKGVVIEKPIQIVWVTAAGDCAFHIPQRMLTVVEENASATLIEQFISTDEQQNCLTHGVTELHLADGARMYHYRFHQESQGSLHVGGVHVSLQRNAYFNSFNMALGSKLKRIDVVINHDGEGAQCDLNGVYLPQQDQHIDYHTSIEHKVPHCTSSENFRGIIGGNGRAVFNGRIRIHRDAQKTLAKLSNKNLLTSNKAEVDSKPELEIYADDVQCAHGTTVAQLDKKSLHYFQTRGISAKKAEIMLSYGFIKELIDGVHHIELIDYLTPLLSDLFAIDPNLAGADE